MIQPQELRLGNYVYDRGEKVIRIDFLEHVEKGYDGKFGQNGEPLSDVSPAHPLTAHPLTEYTDYAKPIPLTEEWLVKLGFEKNAGIWTGSAGFYFTKFTNKEGLYEAFLGRHSLAKFEYVHQLQNLYHALTGEELTIKL